jgi:HK97 family phage portal protein
MRLFRRKGEERTIPSGGPVWPTNGWAPFAPPSPSDSLQVADVYAAVRCLSDAAGSIPLVPYRRTSAGRQRLDSGRLYDLLERPAPATTQGTLTGQMVAHLTLYGNAYLGKFRNADGRLEQLGLLDPTYVEVKRAGGEPVYVVTDPTTGRETRHGTDDIVHIRAMSVDGLVGLSPIGQCKMAVSLNKGLGEFSEAFIRNGARPSGIIRVPSPSNNDQLRNLREGLEDRHGGARNAHKVAIVTGDVSFEAMTGPLDDLQFVEQRHLSTTEICRIFRIPPWMLGAETGASQTYANVEQQALMFVTYSLRPWLVLIEQAISADPDLCSQNVYVEFLLDSLLRADSKTRAEVYALALDPTKGWMTRSEVRRLENLEPEPEPAVAIPLPTQNGQGALIA